MFITTHAAIGALVAEQVPNHPGLAFVLGILSHFLTDVIPHGDTHVYKGYISGSKVKRALAYVTIDGIVSLFFVLFLMNAGLFGDRPTMTMGIIGGVLPDLLVGLYEMTKSPFLRWFHRIHFFFHNMFVHRRRDLTFASGFAMQMVFLAALISRLG